MKRAILAFVSVASVAVVVSAAAIAAPQAGNTLTITHVVKGCHVWSLNGSKPAVKQTIKLHPGQSFTIVNNDVMPHQLVKSTGPSSFAIKLIRSGMAGTGMQQAPYAGGMMPHMSSVVRVTFAKAGVYTFKTKAGEDYTSGVKTVGEDNVLAVKVIVG